MSTPEGERSSELWRVTNRAAFELYEQGQLERAVELFEQTLAGRTQCLGPDHPDTLSSMGNLGAAYKSLGQDLRAIELFEQALAAMVRVYGPVHSETLAIRANLADAYFSGRQRFRAIGVFEQALADQLCVVGPDHPAVLRSRNNLALRYTSLSQFERAIELLQQNLADRLRILGPDHRDTMLTRNNLAHAYQSAGELKAAIQLHERNLAEQIRILGTDHANVQVNRNNLAMAYRSVGRHNEAIQLLELNLSERLRILGGDHPSTLLSRHNLADAYRWIGRLDEAIELFDRNITDRRRLLGPDHPDTELSRSTLDEAHRMRRHGHDHQIPPSSELSAAERRYMRLLVEQGRTQPVTLETFRMYLNDIVTAADSQDINETLATTVASIGNERWIMPPGHPLDDLTVAAEYTFLCIRCMVIRQPNGWRSWIRTFALLANYACDRQARDEGSQGEDRQAITTHKQLAELHGNPGFTAIPVRILMSAAKPVTALAIAFEEVLFRSCDGVEALRLIQQAIFERFITARERLRQSSVTPELYQMYLWDLAYALAPATHGPITKGMVQSSVLTASERAKLDAVFGSDEIKMRRTYDIEMDEARANLWATQSLTKSLAEALPHELANIAHLRGVTAARHWLRECRNIRHFPPKFQFDALDRTLAEGRTSVGLLTGCTMPKIALIGGRDLIADSSDEPQVPVTWQRLLLSITMMHEGAHAMWPVSSGYEGIDDDLADVLTINIKASEKNRHRASDDPGPAHGYERLAILRGGTFIMSERVIAEAPTSAGLRAAPGSADAMDADELSEQIARIIKEAHIRRASDPAEAVAILRRLRLEVAGINASTREMAIIIDNALAGAMRQARNPAGASTVYINCLDACHTMFGADARMSFIVADNLAGALFELGDLEASSHIRRRLVQRLAQVFGREDVTTLRVIHNLGQTEFALGRYAETIKLLEQVVASDQSALGTSEVDAVLSLLAAARAGLR